MLRIDLGVMVVGIFGIIFGGVVRWSSAATSPNSDPVTGAPIILVGALVLILGVSRLLAHFTHRRRPCQEDAAE